MDIKEVTEIYYSIWLYKTEGYECTKYSYKVPTTRYKPLQLFYNKNKFTLNELACHDKPRVVLRCLYALFIMNKNTMVPVIEQEVIDKFQDSLVQYKEELNRFLIGYKVTTAKEVYNLYIKKKIPFYVFYYTLVYVRFSDGLAGQELIQNKLKEVHMLMKFFKHFDVEYFKGKLQELQNYVELSKEN